ncbi:MAG: hypothetical protein WCJ46_00565 [bacterium]
MFCIKCTYEYKEGIKVCPDCGANLETKLTEAPNLGVNFDSVVLADVENDIEGEILSGMLKENGVECFIRINYLPFTRLAIGNVFSNGAKYGTILVNKEKIAQAKNILKDFKKSNKK